MWVTEKRLSALTGLTVKALARKRQRGTIPPDVYGTVDGRVMYNYRRWNRWAGNQASMGQADKVEMEKLAQNI